MYKLKNKYIAITLACFCLTFSCYKNIVATPIQTEMESCCCDTIEQCSDMACSIQQPKETHINYSNSSYFDAVNCFCHNELTTLNFLKNTLFCKQPENTLKIKPKHKQQRQVEKKGLSKIYKKIKKPPRDNVLLS